MPPFLAWILGVGLLGVVVAAVAVIATRPAARARAERRRRYLLPETDQRVPLAEPSQPPHAGPPEVELALAGPDAHVPRRSGLSVAATAEAVDADRAAAGGLPIPQRTPAGRITGRLVRTLEGEAILTTPPFVLRSGVFTPRQARFASALMRRLPAWAVLCPKVRLDTLLTPTPPDGRDPDDWRAWRRRTRLRCVDLLICDRRIAGWKPVLAIVLAHRSAADADAPASPPRSATTVGGGEDRMIDEILHAAGLPMLRVEGDLVTDWAVIAPYVEQMILPSVGEDASEDSGDRLLGVDPDAAVRLLREDADKGWLLE
jgi:hypothetical protein